MTDGWENWGIRLEIEFHQGDFRGLEDSVNWRSGIEDLFNRPVKNSVLANITKN